MRSPHQAAISPHCCAAPATSPVCPPIARRANATMSQGAGAAQERRKERMGDAQRDETERDRDDKPRTPGGGERVRVEPPCRGAGAVGARWRQERERRQRGGAGERGDQHQA